MQCLVGELAFALVYKLKVVPHRTAFCSLHMAVDDLFSLKTIQTGQYVTFSLLKTFGDSMKSTAGCQKSQLRSPNSSSRADQAGKGLGVGMEPSTALLSGDTSSRCTTRV